MPDPPPSLYRISTTAIVIVMRLHRCIHYPSIFFAPFSVGKIISRKPRLAIVTFSTATTEDVAFTFLRPLLCLILTNHSSSIRFFCNACSVPLCFTPIHSDILVRSSCSDLLSLYQHFRSPRFFSTCLHSVPFCSAPI